MDMNTTFGAVCTWKPLPSAARGAEMTAGLACGGRCGFGAQRGLNYLDESAGGHGLRQELADLEAAGVNLVFAVGSAGQYHNRGAHGGAVLAQDGEELNSAVPGKTKVEDDEGRAMAVGGHDGGNGLALVCGDADTIAGALEDVGEESADLGIIVDDEDVEAIGSVFPAKALLRMQGALELSRRQRSHADQDAAQGFTAPSLAVHGLAQILGGDRSIRQQQLTQENAFSVFTHH